MEFFLFDYAKLVISGGKVTLNLGKSLKIVSSCGTREKLSSNATA